MKKHLIIAGAIFIPLSASFGQTVIFHKPCTGNGATTTMTEPERMLCESGSVYDGRNPAGSGFGNSGYVSPYTGYPHCFAIKNFLTNPTVGSTSYEPYSDAVIICADNGLYAALKYMTLPVYCADTPILQDGFHVSWGDAIEFKNAAKLICCANYGFRSEYEGYSTDPSYSGVALGGRPKECLDDGTFGPRGTKYATCDKGYYSSKGVSKTLATSGYATTLGCNHCRGLGHVYEATTASYGATSPTSCYLPTGMTLQDNTGEFTVSSNCYYSN